MSTHDEPLSLEQLARARALGVARGALVERGVLSQGPTDPGALVMVAEWVLTGLVGTEDAERAAEDADDDEANVYPVSDASSPGDSAASGRWREVLEFHSETLPCPACLAVAERAGMVETERDGPTVRQVSLTFPLDENTRPAAEVLFGGPLGDDGLTETEREADRQADIARAEMALDVPEEGPLRGGQESGSAPTDALGDAEVFPAGSPRGARMVRGWDFAASAGRESGSAPTDAAEGGRGGGCPTD